MIVKYINRNTREIDFSDDEKQRLKEIMDELKNIFAADSVFYKIPPSASSKVDCTININGATNPGFDKQRVKEIMDELRAIFAAYSVSLEIPSSVSSRVDCIININGAANPGFVFK